MKAYFQPDSLHVPSSQAAHKAIQQRSHADAKTAVHRYERRKIRELLRHCGQAPDLAPGGNA